MKKQHAHLRPVPVPTTEGATITDGGHHLPITVHKPAGWHAIDGIVGSLPAGPKETEEREFRRKVRAQWKRQNQELSPKQKLALARIAKAREKFEHLAEFNKPKRLRDRIKGAVGGFFKRLFGR